MTLLGFVVLVMLSIVIQGLPPMAWKTKYAPEEQFEADQLYPTKVLVNSSVNNNGGTNNSDFAEQEGDVKRLQKDTGDGSRKPTIFLNEGPTEEAKVGDISDNLKILPKQLTRIVETDATPVLNVTESLATKYTVPAMSVSTHKTGLLSITDYKHSRSAVKNNVDVNETTIINILKRSTTAGPAPTEFQTFEIPAVTSVSKKSELTTESNKTGVGNVEHRIQGEPKIRDNIRVITAIPISTSSKKVREVTSHLTDSTKSGSNSTKTSEKPTHNLVDHMTSDTEETTFNSKIVQNFKKPLINVTVAKSNNETKIESSKEVIKINSSENPEHVQTLTTPMVRFTSPLSMTNGTVVHHDKKDFTTNEQDHNSTGTNPTIVSIVNDSNPHVELLKNNSDVGNPKRTSAGSRLSTESNKQSAEDNRMRNITTMENVTSLYATSTFSRHLDDKIGAIEVVTTMVTPKTTQTPPFTDNKPLIESNDKKFELRETPMNNFTERVNPTESIYNHNQNATEGLNVEVMQNEPKTINQTIKNASPLKLNETTPNFNETEIQSVPTNDPTTPKGIEEIKNNATTSSESTIHSEKITSSHPISIHDYIKSVTTSPGPFPNLTETSPNISLFIDSKSSSVENSSEVNASFASPKTMSEELIGSDESSANETTNSVNLITIKTTETNMKNIQNLTTPASNLNVKIDDTSATPIHVTTAIELSTVHNIDIGDNSTSAFTDSNNSVISNEGSTEIKEKTVPDSSEIFTTSTLAPVNIKVLQNDTLKESDLKLSTEHQEIITARAVQNKIQAVANVTSFSTELAKINSESYKIMAEDDPYGLNSFEDIVSYVTNVILVQYNASTVTTEGLIPNHNETVPNVPPNLTTTELRLENTKLIQNVTTASTDLKIIKEVQERDAEINEAPSQGKARTTSFDSSASSNNVKINSKPAEKSTEEEENNSTTATLNSTKNQNVSNMSTKVLENATNISGSGILEATSSTESVTIDDTKVENNVASTSTKPELSKNVFIQSTMVEKHGQCKCSDQ